MIVPQESTTKSENGVIVLELSKGWQFRQTDTPETGWMPVANVPTNVHLDLLALGKIPDPFIDRNELDVQWVGEKSWTYRCVFTASICSSFRYDLVLEGLDTFATLSINGQRVLTSDNMFVEHRVDVSQHLNAVGRNILVIEFEPALLKARDIQKSLDRHKWICWNGESARLAVRKAQYHWGWDWGPKLMTCGPWKPIRVEIYQVRVVDLWCDIQLDADLLKATIHAHADIEGATVGGVLFEVRQNGELISSQNASVQEGGHVQAPLPVAKPELWWPNGYGSQPLYELSVTLSDNKHKILRKIGIRKVELMQTPDKHGKSFYFRVNDVDIFARGSNWIPADSFTPSISDDRYRKWLQLLADGRQCMVRCWGGGIWEPDVFFDICDELGILVWQDFLFACGNYPVQPSLLASIRAECNTQLRRIRNHPCLTIIAGNNEDYSVQESSGLTYDYKDKDPLHWLQSDFKARYLYELILPNAVKQYCPCVPYHPGSPWGDGKPTADSTVGDVHQWNVWHGSQEKYQKYDQLGGRFVTEFGMESMPHFQTVKGFETSKSELYPGSRTLDFHNKAAGGERCLATYLSENFRVSTDLPDYIHLTQLLQSEAMAYAYKGWRKQWGDRKCGGALCWQLNDCWPGTSWSIVDYKLRKKPAYYAIRRALAPLVVGVQREHHDWSDAHNPPPHQVRFSLWVANSLREKRDVMVELRFVSVRTGVEVQNRVTKSVVAVANGTTEVMIGTLENKDDEPYALMARLFAGSGVASRDVDWPQPLKYHSMHERGVSCKIDGDRIWVTAVKPVKGLVIEERDGVSLSDNGFDVMPGDVQTIQIKGVDEKTKLSFWYYDQPATEDDTVKGANEPNQSSPPRFGGPIGTPPMSPRSPRTGRRRSLAVRFQEPDSISLTK